MREITLDPPTSCDCCQSDKIELVTNDKLFGVKKGKWPYVYRCLNCKASVGCHINTFKPLGLMADRITRLLRKDAHIAFDQLWRSGLMHRSAAYRWLADKLGIPTEVCHIGFLNNHQLRKTIDLASEHFALTKHIAERRKAKRHAKLIRARDYEKQRIMQRKYKS